MLNKVKSEKKKTKEVIFMSNTVLLKMELLLNNRTKATLEWVLKPSSKEKIVRLTIPFSETFAFALLEARNRININTNPINLLTELQKKREIQIGGNLDETNEKEHAERSQYTDIIFFLSAKFPLDAIMLLTSNGIGVKQIG